jgi:hypothetical protein
MGMSFVPEVVASGLSVDAVLSALGSRGALMVRGLMSPDLAGRFRDHLDRAFDARDRYPEPDRWYRRFLPEGPGLVEREWVEQCGSILAVDSPPTLAHVLAVYKSFGVVDLAAQVLGEYPAMSARKMTLRRSYRDVGATSWHQESSFLGANAPALNVWLALSDSGIDAPGLDVVARHVDEVLPTGSNDTDGWWYIASGIVERRFQHDIVRPVFGPGDALLFDHHTIHRTGVSSSMTKQRDAIETWFFAPSRPPLDWIPFEIRP